MAGCAFLGVTTKLHRQWKDQMGGPSVPSNWKDPAKIQAKIQEWESKAESKSPEYPLARTVDAWVVLNKDGEAMLKGEGAVALISELKKHEDQIIRVYGYRARSILKGASIEALEAGITPPMWCWRYSIMDTEGTRVHDLTATLVSGFKERMELEATLARIGMAAPAEGAGPEELAAFMHQLHGRLMG